MQEWITKYRLPSPSSISSGQREKHDSAMKYPDSPSGTQVVRHAGMEVKWLIGKESEDSTFHFRERHQSPAATRPTAQQYEFSGTIG